MGISCTASAITGYFVRKLEIFPYPMYFTPTVGFPWSFVTVMGLKKLE